MLLEAAAALYGGTVQHWLDAPAAGYYQLTTKATELDVLIPPIPTLVSQYYELWSGGGCKRRCDGENELLSGGPCLCDADARQRKEKGTCQVTTRISVMLPRLAGVGVWRLESHGWNAATTLPGTLEMLAGTGQFIKAVLRAEQRTEKKNNETRKFVVPVIDLPDLTFGALLESQASGSGLLLGGPAETPANVKVARPSLPPPAELPDENQEWKGDASPANGGSKKLDAIMRSLDDLGSTEVGTWKKNMSATLAGLPKGERARVDARIAEIEGNPLPFGDL
jgi:hypothetical protein